MTSPLQVYIIHWNQPDGCLASVRSLLEQSVPVRLCVVDNASSAANRERLLGNLSAITDVEVMTLEENLGFGPAANVALKQWLESGDGEWVGIAAHDAIPTPDCLRLLLAATDKKADAGIVCPEYGVNHRPRLSAARGAVLEPAQHERGWEPVAFPHGTLLLLRRQCLASIGLFDERYFAYGDEQDLGLRANRAGWQVGVVWGALVQNPSRAVPSRAACYLQMRNSILLTRVHMGFAAACLRTAVAIANTPLLLAARSRRNDTFAPWARLLAVLDIWRGRLGRPPSRLLGASK